MTSRVGDNSHYNEKWSLPSERKKYVSNHMVTHVAQLHDSSNNKIPPVWSKVTKTPWLNLYFFVFYDNNN